MVLLVIAAIIAAFWLGSSLSGNSKQVDKDTTPSDYEPYATSNSEMSVYP